jgi:hypothetical protein
MDEASRAIWQGLDEQKVSAGYVRDMRRGGSEWKEGVSALPVPERRAGVCGVDVIGIDADVGRGGGDCVGNGGCH